MSTAFLDACPRVLAAFTEFGEGAKPSVEVVNGCEYTLCLLLYHKQLHIFQANTLGRHLFKQLKPDQGVNKLPPTLGDETTHPYGVSITDRKPCHFRPFHAWMTYTVQVGKLLS